MTQFEFRRPSADVLAVVGVGICAVIWGTTWYAITWQLGTVDPVASLVWRFGLAALVLIVGCAVTGRSLKLTRSQHLAALGQGAFVFAISYSFTYAAEGHVASAIVAVVFAALAFLNLVMFRLVVGQKASRAAWMGAGLGIIGVAVLSGGEALGAGFDQRALTGIGLAVLAVLSSAVGNYFSWKGQTLGSAVLPQTGWAMAYGTAMLALYGFATGAHFTIDPSPGYLISLAHLSLLGSVVAFVVYFSVARARGYALASYISALTPPIAMLVSVLFEDARFGWTAAAGLMLVLAGQALLIRAPKVP
ncbi:MAG: EamA family transporter [Alphaproteobacteria bacterium]|nr:EamA family transporter [Alphaproteobacteria bacterium]